MSIQDKLKKAKKIVELLKETSTKKHILNQLIEILEEIEKEIK